MSNIIGPVARWLETFLCQQYADIFENFGYTTLQQVCSLNLSTLISMGVSSIDSEKIIENVSVLRQTLQLTGSSISYNNNQYDNLQNTIRQDGNNSNTKQQKKSKTKSNDSKLKQNDNYNLSAPPNITINNNQMQNRYNSNIQQIPSKFTSNKANTDVAKQIANDILTITKNTNINTNYTCIPLNQSSVYSNNNNNNNNNNSKYLNSKNQYWENDQLNNTPLKSLERLVALPETQVIDPKSVVNDNNDSNYEFDNSYEIQYSKNNNNNNLKRVNNYYDYNNELYSNNKKPCNIQHIPNKQLEQQNYYNNNNNNYTYLSEQQINDQYLCEQQQSQQQQFNEKNFNNNNNNNNVNNYYTNENNNNDRINMNYNYSTPSLSNHQHNQIPTLDYNYSNDQFNQQYQYSYHPQQQLQQQQQYYNYHTQQQQFDINSGLI